MQNRIIEINTTYITYPQANTTYFLRDTQIPTKRILITFEGRDLGKVYQYDVASGRVNLKDGSFGYIKYPNESLIISHSFPSTYHSKKLPKIMVYTPNNLSAVTEMSIKINPSVLEYNYKDVPLPLTYHQFDAANLPLPPQDKKIPIILGEYPIFVDDANKPSIEQLNLIYQNFFKACKNKLTLKSENDRNKCALRAHFVNDILNNYYAIDSMKAYKFYNSYEWYKFKDSHYWDFHCVSLIPCGQGKYGVWDPWLNPQPFLVPFEKWIVSKNEPTITKVLITNNLVINDTSEGKFHEGGTNFFALNLEEERNAFQKLARNILPNHPLSARKLSSQLLTWLSKANLPEKDKVAANKMLCNLGRNSH